MPHPTSTPSHKTDLQGELRKWTHGPLSSHQQPNKVLQRHICQFSNLAPALNRRPRHTQHRQISLDQRRLDVALRQIKRPLNRLQRLGQKARRTIRSLYVDHTPRSSVQREARTNSAPGQSQFKLRSAINPPTASGCSSTTTHQPFVINCDQHWLDINQ